MVVELEVGLRSLSVVFMCWFKFCVFLYAVHTGGEVVGAYRFAIIHN